ncbi:hydrocephalus-inducing protein homolog [Phaenicophaeus curvirostris]|uniref:hydrocephalus-inducing protein homolog n=1 Tax=Phaenicophaeus curvirostris TaxID=33595 RepID=UPI0037F0DB87
MAAGRSYQPVGLPKRADGFQSKVATSRDWKRGREAEKPLTVSTGQPTPSAFVKEKSLTTKQTLAPTRVVKLPQITQRGDMNEASHHKPTPSAFVKEKSLTTKQMLAPTREVKLPQITQLRDMNEASHHKFSAVDLQKSLFQPFPSELVFQNFVPPEVYEKAVVLRNNDKVPRLVMVAMESSPYFKLVSHNRVWQKVLPGMTATFRIRFMSEKNKDYSHQLTCTTEKEKFIVPIRAIGPRAVLDFPAHLDFSICPVKYSTQKTLLIHNVGNREARYHISTHSPFSVDPSIGNLGIGEATQVTVEFHPLETGDHSGCLVVHYDTGERIQTRLYGLAVDANIGLEKGSLTFEKTSLTQANRGSVVLHNQSEITAHFQWKAAATQEQEDQQKLRLCRRLQKQENEVDCFLKECTEVPTLREHVPLLSRGFQQQRAKVQGDPMLFSSDIFTIDPVEGDVLPNSSIEINVIFKPQEARVYQQTVYCDISGREARLPLHIKAEGIQTGLCFSYEQLDIGNVSVGSARSYEVFLFNKGVIDGAFSLIPPSTALGCCFTFHPQNGIISPNGLRVIKISFSSTILGKFTEEFRFRVNGSAEPLTLTIRGCVTGPAFHFAVPSLNFGDVPFGECTLGGTAANKRQDAA